MLERYFLAYGHQQSISTVLQALRELNFVLANRPPELSAHLVYHCNLDKSPLRRYPTLLVHTLPGPLPTQLSMAVEEDQEPGVINITDIQDSPHQFRGTINRHAGQMFTLTLTKINHIIKLATIVGIGVICFPHLIT